MKHSAALPLTWVALRVLLVLNWLSGAAILGLLVWSITHEEWTLTALGVLPSADTRPLVIGMRAIAALGLLAVPLNYVVLERLLAILATVRGGDPFERANAFRLQAIAWPLLALQLLGLVIGGIGKAVSTPAHALHLDAGFSVSGWLAVCLTLVLARVFAQGTLMRKDFEGTV